MIKQQLFWAAALLGLAAMTTQAATITDPVPYLSAADTPDGFFDVPNSVHCFQDFENADGPWQIDFSIDNGMRIGPKFISGDGVPVTDSVEADDGDLTDGGTMGSSWFAPKPFLNITFSEPTTVASFVFTDADSKATKITITAFNDNYDVLASREYDADFLDDVFTGTTAEDRFFGITAASGEGIRHISVEIDAGTGIEIDHVQFLKGIVIPEPGSMTLSGIGLLGLWGYRRRRV